MDSALTGPSPGARGACGSRRDRAAWQSAAADPHNAGTPEHQWQRTTRPHRGEFVGHPSPIASHPDSRRYRSPSPARSSPAAAGPQRAARRSALAAASRPRPPARRASDRAAAPHARTGPHASGRVVDINALRALARPRLRPRAQAITPPAPHAAPRWSRRHSSRQRRRRRHEGTGRGRERTPAAPGGSARPWRPCRRARSPGTREGDPATGWARRSIVNTNALRG